MILLLMIIFCILGIILMIWGACDWDDDSKFIIGLVFVAISGVLLIIGCFTGFINHPKTEGTHQGVITAVDLEGIWFRRYEVYLKSNGYTQNDNGIAEETKYLIYENETELAEQLKECIGKKVKLTYGHDGGYISWKSCGTYHIKSVEILEDKE